MTGVGGYHLGRLPPEVEQLHFAPRVKAPVLMINAESDLTFPLETSQKPMFAHLGLLFAAGIYLPPQLVTWFQNVAKLLG